MAAGEGEAVVLVPVLQAEVRQRRRVGKLEVGEVPVDDLPVPRGEVDVGGRLSVQLLQFLCQILLLLLQFVKLLNVMVQIPCLCSKKCYENV